VKADSPLLWPPGVPAGLALLAIAQMGVHLAFLNANMMPASAIMEMQR
jgi:hypothetical protein